MFGRFLALLILGASLLSLSYCSSSTRETFLRGSSEPISKSEETAQARAMHRCVKTGGTRVVKIGGNLRCF